MRTRRSPRNQERLWRALRGHVPATTPPEFVRYQTRHPITGEVCEHRHLTLAGADKCADERRRESHMEFWFMVRRCDGRALTCDEVDALTTVQLGKAY